MDVQYQSIWAEGRAQIIARQALRRESLIRRINNEANHYYFMKDRGNYYQDQYSAEDRLGKKEETKWYFYLAAVVFLIAIGFQLADYAINLLDK